MLSGETMTDEYKDASGKMWYVHSFEGIRKGVFTYLLTEDKVWRGKQPIDLPKEYEIVPGKGRPLVAKHRTAAEQKEYDAAKEKKKANRAKKKTLKEVTKLQAVIAAKEGARAELEKFIGTSTTVDIEKRVAEYKKNLLDRNVTSRLRVFDAPLNRMKKRLTDLQASLK